MTWQANSFQLLHYQAPQSALLVGLCTPLFDRVVGPGGFLQVGGKGRVGEVRPTRGLLPTFIIVSTLSTHHLTDASCLLLLQFEYTSGLLASVLLSCLLAYGVNLSTYLVIGHTSPVSYQVGGRGGGGLPYVARRAAAGAVADRMRVV